MNEAERLSRRWFEEGWRNGDVGVFRELAPSAIQAELATGHIDTLAEFLDFRRELLSAIPDLAVKVEDVLAGDDRTAVRWSFSGHHKGRGFGLEPTGREVSARGTTWQTIRDGKIVEGIDCWDLGGLFESLRRGAGEPP